jgi:hypothetical protein
MNRLQASTRARSWVPAIALLIAVVASFIVCMMLIRNAADRKLGAQSLQAPMASPAVMVAQASPLADTLVP